MFEIAVFTKHDVEARKCLGESIQKNAKTIKMSVY